MFALQRTGKNAEPHCVYWENSQEEGGFWLDKGCITNLKSSNETHLTCECYHLTNFAVLMSVTDAADNVNVRTLFSRTEARIQEKKNCAILKNLLQWDQERKLLIESLIA